MNSLVDLAPHYEFFLRLDSACDDIPDKLFVYGEEFDSELMFEYSFVVNNFVKFLFVHFE